MSRFKMKRLIKIQQQARTDLYRQMTERAGHMATILDGRIREAAQVAGGFVTDVSILNDQKHVLLDHTSRLTFLADVIPLRAFGVGQVLSIGDVFLAVGLGAFLESELRKPIHWFKRGAGGQAGSATSS